VSPRPVPRVGERLREARQRRGVSVRSLARELGVSASLISQIETGKSQPSVSTLYAMTTALGISVEDVFASVPAGDASEVVDGAREAVGGLPGTVLAALGAARGQRVGPVVRPGDRQVLQLDSGVTWERLGQLPHPHVDFLLITYEPGGASSSESGLMRHAGSEYGYLLSGELVLTLGPEELRLGPGDAISFDSTTPHRYRNDGLDSAVGVWFVTEPASNADN
jgi:transcriptional regulator with XRE-family HTH domain/quercetin dioxygenase-like cupin family protein